MEAGWTGRLSPATVVVQGCVGGCGGRGQVLASLASSPETHRT